MPLMRWIGRATMSPAQRMRRSRFEISESAVGRVVFFGDSITEQGLWDEWFPNLPLLNRGVGGETVAELTARVDPALRGSRAVSVLVGTNDITGFGRSRKTADISDDYRGLLDRIRQVLPDTPVLVNSVLPRDRFSAGKVSDLNARLQRLAVERRMTYVDAWSRMRDPQGAIRSELSLDRIHLTGRGYHEWLTALRPALDAALEDVGPSQDSRSAVDDGDSGR